MSLGHGGVEHAPPHGWQGDGSCCIRCGYELHPVGDVALFTLGWATHALGRSEGQGERDLRRGWLT